MTPIAIPLEYAPKVYFFFGSQYLSYDVTQDEADEGFPKDISATWKSAFAKNIDAAVTTPSIIPSSVVGPEDVRVYFFKGSQYLRFNLLEKRADEGYPKDIATNWKGLFGSDIDAAFWTPAGVPAVQSTPKIYFFKGSEYIRFDVANNKADAGYPREIPDKWRGIW